MESAQALTERQRKLREGTDALRQKGYDQMIANIWKDRANKQAQMQAEAAAKANEALAAYRASQKNQTDALTPVKVEEVNQSARQHSTGADLNVSKKETEDALRGKKGKLLDKQADAAAARAEDSRSHVGVNNSQTAKNRADIAKTQKTTPKYSKDEYAKKFIRYFNWSKKQENGGLAAIYEAKYNIGKQGDDGKQWDASLQRMFVDDMEARGDAPKSSGLSIGKKDNSKHLNI